jgi:putative transposase
MGKLYDTDLSDAAWMLVRPHLPAGKPGGRPRSTCLRAVVNAVFYLLRTGCQWRLLPRGFPPRSTVYHYYAAWRRQGVWTRLQWALHKSVRLKAGRGACPTVAIMDGQSVRTTERGGVRGFDAHKRVKGRKRHILVDTLGLPFASRVEPAGVSDRVAGRRLVGGLRFAFPDLSTIVADAGHESRKLARHLEEHDGYALQIVKRRQRAFKVTGLTWIVERSIAWLNRNRRLAKDYEYRVQSSETMIDIAAIRLMLNRLASA